MLRLFSFLFESLLYLLVSFNGPEDAVAALLVPAIISAAVVGEICAEAVEDEIVVGASINEGFVAVGVHGQVLEQTGFEKLVQVVGVMAEPVFVAQDCDDSDESVGVGLGSMGFFSYVYH